MVLAKGHAFEPLRREAKRLLKAIRHGDEAETQRFVRYWPATRSSTKAPTLAQAQLVIAREYGYRSWTHLKTSLLSTKERTMNVKTVVDQVMRARNRGAIVHVLTGNEDDVQALLNELSERDVTGVGRTISPTQPMPTRVIPEARIVVGVWSDYGFAYITQALAAHDSQAELDKLLGSAMALIAGVSDDARKSPLIVSITDTGQELGSLTYSALIGKYKTAKEV